MAPALELVRATNSIKHFLAGLQPEMICVIEAKPAACFLKLLWSDALQ